LREHFAAKGLLLISLGASMRELECQFKNTGASWEKRPAQINDHDLRSSAEQVAIPDAVHGMQTDQGIVLTVGNSSDGPEFVVDAFKQ